MKKQKQYISYQNSKKILVTYTSKSKLFNLKSNNTITKNTQQSEFIKKENFVSKSSTKENNEKIISSKTAKNSKRKIVINKNLSIKKSLKREKAVINHKNCENNKNQYNIHSSSKMKLLKKINKKHQLNIFHPNINNTKNEILVNLLNMNKVVKKQNSFKKSNRNIKNIKNIFTRNNGLKKNFISVSINSFRQINVGKKCIQGSDKKNNSQEKYSNFISFYNDDNILKTEISCNTMKTITDTKLEVNNSNLVDLFTTKENLNISEIKNEETRVKENAKNFVISSQKQNETFLNFISQYDKNNKNKNNNRINKYKNVILNKKYKNIKRNSNNYKLEEINKSHSVDYSSSCSSYELISFIKNNSKNSKNCLNDSEIILKCLKEGTNLSKKRYITLNRKLSKINISPRNKSYKENYKFCSKISPAIKSYSNNKKNTNFGKKFLRLNNSRSKIFKNVNKKNKIAIKDYLSLNKINTKDLKLDFTSLNSYRNINQTYISTNQNIKTNKIFLGNIKLNTIKNCKINNIPYKCK